MLEAGQVGSSSGNGVSHGGFEKGHREVSGSLRLGPVSGIGGSREEYGTRLGVRGGGE